MPAPPPNEIGISTRDAPRSRSHGVDAAIGAWAASHYGIVTRRKLLALGLSDHDVRGRVRRGTLLPAGPGVFLVGHRSGVPGQREALALAAAGPGAYLAGVSAAAWRGMTDPVQGAVHLLAPHARAGRLHGVVRHNGVLAAADRGVVRGLPCVAPERAVMDLPPEHLRRSLQWLMRRSIAVEPIVERMRGRRGVASFRAEVEQLVPQLAHTMSELEARFVRLCERFGIPAPVVNGLLADGDLIDVSWPGKRLVVELDGRRWHEHRDREDRARDRRRLLEGRIPFRYGWFDVTRDGERTALELRRALAMA